MRSLLLSILSLLILIGSFGIFCVHSEKTLDQMIEACSDSVMPAIEEQRWEQAFSHFQTQYDTWRDYRKTALFFLDTETINETDVAFAKTLMYIRARDLSNGSGELLALQAQLTFLYENQQIRPENIL